MADKNKVFAKIIYTRMDNDPGTIFEHRFETQDEAEAFVFGFESARQLDTEDEVFEDYAACIDDQAVIDEAVT